jgi:hypothetical protein
LVAVNCYANGKTTHLPIIVLISVSNLDDARAAREVKAGRAAGARCERTLSVYFSVLIENGEAQAGFEPPLREKNAIASWYKFGQAYPLSPKFKQYERSSRFANVMVTPSMLKKT